MGYSLLLWPWNGGNGHEPWDLGILYPVRVDGCEILHQSPLTHIPKYVLYVLCFIRTNSWQLLQDFFHSIFRYRTHISTMGIHKNPKHHNSSRRRCVDIAVVWLTRVISSASMVWNTKHLQNSNVENFQKQYLIEYFVQVSNCFWKFSELTWKFQTCPMRDI